MDCLINIVYRLYGKMAIKKKICTFVLVFSIIVSSLYIKNSLYVSVLVPARHHCSSCISTSDGTEDIKERESHHTFNHNSTKHIPLDRSESPRMLTTPLKHTKGHNFKHRKDPTLTDNDSPNTPMKTGYIMSTGYSGWTGGGTGALLQLQCYLKLNALPMQVVEPAIENSKFHAVFYERTLRFSDLFDIVQYNQLLKQDGKYVPLSPWNDFVQNAPRSTVVIKLHVNPQAKPPEVECETGPRVTKCGTPKELDLMVAKGFRVVKIVNVFYPSNVPFTVEELKQNILGRWSPDNVTVVMSRWTYSYYIPPSAGIDDHCGNAEWTGRKVLYPSERLLKDIKQYEKLFLNPQASVAVLMHTERLMGKESESTIMQNANLHLKELISTVQELKAKFPNEQPFGAVDIGKFGSLTLSKAFSVGAKDSKSNLIQSIKNTLTEMYDNKWTFSEWEDSFLRANGGIADTGYVAAIQRGVASRARCLVLFGGGRFQFLALNEYIHNHPKESDQCIHYVFVADRFKKYYDEQ